MTYEVKTPILLLATDATRWLFHEAGEINASEHRSFDHFISTLLQLPPVLLAGSPARPVDRADIERLTDAWTRLPLHLRCKLAEWARTHECAHQLAEWVGPLPARPEQSQT